MQRPGVHKAPRQLQTVRQPPLTLLPKLMVFNTTAGEYIISNTPPITLCDSELCVKFAHTSSSLWGPRVFTQQGQGCAGGDVRQESPAAPAPPAAHGTHGGSPQPGLLPAPPRTQPQSWGCSAPNPGPGPGQLLAPRIAQISCRGSNNCPRDGKHQLFPASWERCWAGRAGRGAAQCWPPTPPGQLATCYALSRSCFIQKKERVLERF